MTTTSMMTVFVGRDTGIASLLSRLAARSREVAARRQAAAEYRELLKADDSIFRDIGVSRGDVVERLMADDHR